MIKKTFAVFSALAALLASAPFDATAAPAKYIGTGHFQWFNKWYAARDNGEVVVGPHGGPVGGPFSKMALPGVTAFFPYNGQGGFLLADQKTFKVFDGSAATTKWTYPETVRLIHNRAEYGQGSIFFIAIGLVSNKVYLPPMTSCGDSTAYPAWTGCSTSFPWALKNKDGTFFDGSGVTNFAPFPSYKIGTSWINTLALFKSDNTVWAINNDTGGLRPAQGSTHCPTANGSGQYYMTYYSAWWDAKFRGCTVAGSPTNPLPGGFFGVFRNSYKYADDPDLNLKNEIVGTVVAYNEGAATVTLDASASSVSGYYVGMDFFLRTSALSSAPGLADPNVGLIRRILAYDGTTKTATLDGPVAAQAGFGANYATLYPMPGDQYEVKLPARDMVPRVSSNGFYQVMDPDNPSQPLLAKGVAYINNSVDLLFVMANGGVKSTRNPCLESANTMPPAGFATCASVTPQALYDWSPFLAGQLVDRIEYRFGTIFATTGPVGLMFKTMSGELWTLTSDTTGVLGCSPDSTTSGYLKAVKAFPTLDHSKISTSVTWSVYGGSEITFVTTTDGALLACGYKAGVQANTASGPLTLERPFPMLPAAISNVIVSDGSGPLQKTLVTWNTDSDATSYVIYRGTSPATLTQIAETPAPADFGATTGTFEDTPPDGTVYYYTVAGKNSVGTGPMGNNDSGWANYAPTSTSVSMLWDIAVASAAGAGKITGVPVNLDPNPTDTFTYEILTQPSDGLVTYSIATGKFEFLPTAQLSNATLPTEVNTFTYRATDKNGESVVGTGRVRQSCPSPSIDSATAAAVVEWSNGMARVQFDSHPCFRSAVVDFTLKDGETVIFTEAVPTSLRGSNQVVDLQLPALDDKAYTLEAKVSGQRWDGSLDGANQLVLADFSTTKTGGYTVQKAQAPTFLATRWVVVQDEEETSIEARTGGNCPIVDESAAALDFTKCFGGWTAVPAGLATAADTNLKLVGVASEQGTHPVTYTVSKYDPSGGVHVVNSVSNDLVVNVPVPPVFELRSSHLGEIRRLMERLEITVRQTSGSPCELWMSEAEAATRALGGVRACSVTFPSLDPDLGVNLVNGVVSVKGRFKSVGLRNIDWVVKRHMRNGSTVDAGGGSYAMNVNEHGMTFSWKSLPESRELMALVSNMTSELLMAGRGCSLTTSRIEAMNSITPTATAIRCFAEFTGVPTGVNPDPRYPFRLKGALPAPGEYTIGYNAMVIFPDGTEIPLSSGEATWTATPIRPPEIEVQPFKTLAMTNTDGSTTSVMAYELNGAVGRVRILSSVATTVDVEVYKNDVLYQSMPNLRVRSVRAIVPEAPEVWQMDTYRVVAKYTLYPDIQTEQSLTVMATLPRKLMAQAVAPRLAHDNQGQIEVVAQVGLRRYDPELQRLVLDGTGLGPWKSQAGTVTRDRTTRELIYTPITPEVDMVNGEATLHIDPLMPVTAFVVKSWPVIPIAGVDSSKLTYYARPTKIRVVQGSPIEGSLAVKERAVLYNGINYARGWIFVRIPDRNAFTALGHVDWYRSYDEGTTWELWPDMDNRRFIVDFVDRTTTYKAEFTNKYSELKSESEPFTLSVADNSGVAMSSTSAASTSVATVPENAGPYEPLTFTVGASNAALRVPVTVTATSTTNTGSGVYEWSLDSLIVPGQSSYKGVMSITTPGEHVISARSGVNGEYKGQYTITATPNQPATCTMSDYMYPDNARSKVSAVCSDADGKIVGAVWTVDGLVVKTSMPYIYVLNGGTGPRTVVLKVTDDSGEVATFNYVVNFPSS